MVRRMKTEHGYGQRSIGAQNGYNDLTSEGVNDEQEILATMHERAMKKKGSVPGHSEKAQYGSSSGRNNSRANDRGSPESYVSNHSLGETPDDKKLSRQKMPNDRMYSYVQ